jgi:hypothetical protein
MKKSNPTFIHLGLPKTATTCIQSHLFANHSQIHYFGKYVNSGFPPVIRAILASRHVRAMELGEGDIRAQSIQEQLAYAADRQRVPVLSKEGFGGGSPALKRRQARQFVRNLGPCKAFLVVREPVSFIKSYYSQMLKAFQKREPHRSPDWMRRMGSPPRYFDINEWLEKSWRASNTPRNLLAYHQTAKTYAQFLGRENLRIFVFEEFIRSPERFITDLSEYIGIDPHESVELIRGKRANDRITTGYIRRLQEIEHSEELSRQFQDASVRRLVLNPAELDGDKFRPELEKKWQDKIETFCRKQNRRLAKEWDLPLADYGYRI